MEAMYADFQQTKKNILESMTKRKVLFQHQLSEVIKNQEEFDKNVTNEISLLEATFDAFRVQAERDRIVREQAERDRVVREQAERDRIVREQAERDRVVREQAERDRIVREQQPKQTITHFKTNTYGNLGDAVRSLPIPQSIINQHLEWIENTSANDNGKREYQLGNTKYILCNTRLQVFFSHECSVLLTTVVN